jgi:CubicO group peptidase (beta-lactamase class C family)
MKTMLALALLFRVTAHAGPPKDVSALLKPIIQQHNVPGMAVAVVRNGETAALGVAGVRTRGKPDKIELADRLHIGSDTKAITAMLCGILVDEGKLKWSQTVGETFPELKSMNARTRPSHSNNSSPTAAAHLEIFPRMSFGVNSQTHQSPAPMFHASDSRHSER